MSGIILRWGVPALLTVVGGTALAVSITSGSMADALAARTSDLLVTDSSGWISVNFEYRDAVLTGTAASSAEIDAVAQRIAAVHGVSAVRSEVVVAESATPFPFAAAIADGEVSLTGGIPDESLRDDIAELTGARADGLRHLSGAPSREAWYPAIAFGVELLGHLDKGEVTFADLELAVDGRARSSAAFDELTRLMAAVPDGVTLGNVDIAPPLASPFIWRASFDGVRVAVSGFTPTTAFLETLQSWGQGGYPVSTSLRLASGAPENFEERALTLLENLVLLEDGVAEVSDADLKLTGAPPDIATVDRVRTAMTAIGAGFDLAPPRIDAYTFSGEKRPEGIALTGHVPTTALRDRLGEAAGVDASGLDLARGAPERFESAIDFGLELLSYLSEGRFTIENTSISITGRAATVTDYGEAETAISLGSPQGLILAFSDIRPPLADPFTWRATKTPDGIALSGYVPSNAARTRLQTAAIEVDTDTMILADGAPEDFESLAGTALRLLQLMDTAEAGYDGEGWTLAGAVSSAEAAVAVDAAYAESGLRSAGWSFDLDAPEPEPVPPPRVTPYIWTAQKASTRIVSLSGHVPTSELQQTLVADAGAGAVDELSIASGDPEGFAESASAGLDALVQLQEGEIGFDGKAWSLTGSIGTAEQRTALENELQAALDTSAWRIQIQARDAPPVVADYTWAATKSADGELSLSGYVANGELKRFIMVRAGEDAVDTTEIASGEPAGFVADVLAGLEALGYLREGSARLEDGAWILEGTPLTDHDSELAVAALDTTDASRWTTRFFAPAAPGPEAPDEAVPTPEPTVRDYTFVATKRLGAGIELRGTVPTVNAGDFLGVIAGGAGTEALAVSGDLPAGFTPVAAQGIRALMGLASGEFGLDGTEWVLTGRTETEAERTEVMKRFGALVGAEDWTTSVDVLTALERCSERVAVFANRNAILFQSGSARLAEESNTAIDELAGYLKICPDAIVHVEGHTDADGADDLNLALSVARAETVVEALIERGVKFQRLYAVGYGEGLPVADNDTIAGKRANRRIAFTILDEHR